MSTKSGPLPLLLGLSLCLAAGCAASISSKVALSPGDSYGLTATKMEQFGQGLAYYDLCVQSGGPKLRGLGAWLKKHRPDQAEELIAVLVEAHVASLEKIMAELNDKSLPKPRAGAPAPELRALCRKNAHLYEKLEFPEP